MASFALSRHLRGVQYAGSVALVSLLEHGKQLCLPALDNKRDNRFISTRIFRALKAGDRVCPHFRLDTPCLQLLLEICCETRTIMRYIVQVGIPYRVALSSLTCERNLNHLQTSASHLRHSACGFASNLTADAYSSPRVRILLKILECDDDEKKFNFSV